MLIKYSGVFLSSFLEWVEKYSCELVTLSADIKVEEHPPRLSHSAATCVSVWLLTFFVKNKPF